MKCNTIFKAAFLLGSLLKQPIKYKTNFSNYLLDNVTFHNVLIRLNQYLRSTVSIIKFTT